MGVLLAVMVLALAGVLIVTLWLGRSAERRADQPLPAPPSSVLLRYVVPEGQDPAAVVAALGAAGLAAKSEQTGDVRTVVVALDRDTVLDREDVRTLIGDAGSTIQDGVAVTGVVRFDDEVVRPRDRRSRRQA